ncbi:uncharacterized protein LOC141617222 [Silene latifolia]|uniref:uncharacterized protein LOC141617222 n=1 Tax=Silene latifolia TaxID=37657 RepID=UPI003D7852F5
MTTSLLRSLIPASPHLWELSILESNDKINFCCSTLKILKLSTVGIISGSIGVPNLEYFELIQVNDSEGNDWYHLIMTGDMQQLAEAKVDCCMKLAAWGDLFEALRHVIKLNVAIRPIYEDDLTETTTVHLKLPYFNRLKYLEIHCIEEHCILQTGMLLKHMPNCVSLIIHMLWSWSSDVDELEGWPEVDSLGLGLHVEYIEIDGFGRNKLVSVELLKYLLVCCTKLKEVKLHLHEPRLSDKQKNVMRKTVMKLSRPSGCKIIINDLPSELTCIPFRSNLCLLLHLLVVGTLLFLVIFRILQITIKICWQSPAISISPLSISFDFFFSNFYH